MRNEKDDITSSSYYSNPERRLAGKCRRSAENRRHRIRNESLISDCRTNRNRRKEDEDGYIEVSNLYTDNDS
ncbi:hypothetical protein MNBD_GAMMA09-3242 [hydrothermal vent metagenome]|uniref:Uncharacterized protein n=1 Tax=hydrothermal vent metagenome TaxID=652676 RepID=A0A3B0XWR6_9ZZZZ